MYNLVEDDLFTSTSSDLIIVPISTSGTISMSFQKGLNANNIACNLRKKNYELGEVEFVAIRSFKTFTRFIAYACTVHNNHSYYNTVRLIAKEIRQFADENRIITIASPVLGSGAGKLDPYNSINIFIRSFFENMDSSIWIDIFVYNNNIFKTLKKSKFDTNSSSSKLVIEAELPRIVREESIKKIIHEKDYYFEYANRVFQEYLQIGILKQSSSLDNWTDVIDKAVNSFFNKKLLARFLHQLNSSRLTFGNFFVNFQGTEAHLYFFQLCGELIAYINYNAIFKNLWNKYPDKRVFAHSNIQLREWFINLIKFKIEEHNVKNIPDKNIRNAFEYLLEPENNLTILSEDHRRLIFENILSQEYNGKDSLPVLFNFFDNLTIPCHNPRNRGVLYSKILYLPYIKEIWTQDSFETSDTSDDLSFASNLIFNNLKQKSTSLDLGNCGLTDISMLPELFECTHLEELILSNEWGESDGDLWRLNTSKNSEKRNILKSLPPEIGKLKKLKRLICGGDWNYNKNQNNDSPFSEWGIESLSALTELENLEYLNASNNSIYSLEGITGLKKLKTIQLNNNHILLIDAIAKLTNLEGVYLSNNTIENILPLKNLPNLNSVDLHANRIKDVSILVKLIDKLGIGNSKWKVGTINVAKNPLEKPPVEIISNGKEAVLQYIKDIQTNKTYVNKDIKVILVGNSEVGKTTLAKYFDNETDLDKPHPSTHWMEEKEIRSKYHIEVINGNCIIHLFDFGGHDYFHDTHHLFYGSNTIYLLLWDKETNRLALRDCVQENWTGKKVSIQTQDYPVKYWLESVKHFIKDVEAENFEFEFEREETYNSQLLLIQNKVKNSGQVVHLNNKALAEKYPFIYDFIHISVMEKRNLAYLDTLLTEMLNKSNIIGAVLPDFYRIIKEGIKVYEGKPVLTIGEFCEYCNKLLEYPIEANQCEFLADYLSKIGAILWFPNGENRDKIYIDKKWVIKTIHDVLNDLTGKKGEFDFSHAAAYLTDDKQTADIIDIMTDFNIIFKHPYKDSYIAPLYLPHMPEKTIHLFLNKKEIPYRRFEYSGFIHKHVVLSFFKEYATFIMGDKDICTYYYWKDGLIIKDPVTEAIVMIKFNIGTENGNAFIDIFDTGNTGDISFISSVIQHIKDINKGYETEEMVTIDGNDFVSLDVLTANARDGKLIFTGQRKSDKSKPPTARQKLFKLKDYTMYITGEIKKKKVVISYSKKDLEHTQTLRRYLQPLVDNDLIEQPWYCTYMNPAEEWDERIKEKFDHADIVFFMVSEHFYATKYIIETEIQHTINRYNKDKSVKIVPIILEFYDWHRKEPYNLQRFAALPYHAKPVSDFKNPKMAWYTIAESVKSMIEKDLDPGKEDSITRELQEIYERQVKGKLDNNAL